MVNEFLVCSSTFSVMCFSGAVPFELHTLYAWSTIISMFVIIGFNLIFILKKAINDLKLIFKKFVMNPIKKKKKELKKEKP